MVFNSASGNLSVSLFRAKPFLNDDSLRLRMALIDGRVVPKGKEGLLSIKEILPDTEVIRLLNSNCSNHHYMEAKQFLTVTMAPFLYSIDLRRTLAKLMNKRIPLGASLDEAMEVFPDTDILSTLSHSSLKVMTLGRVKWSDGYSVIPLSIEIRKAQLEPMVTVGLLRAEVIIPTEKKPSYGEPLICGIQYEEQKKAGVLDPDLVIVTYQEMMANVGDKPGRKSRGARSAKKKAP
jgi:hypothetical protein